MIAVVVSLIVVFAVNKDDDNENSSKAPTKNDMAYFENGAVATDAEDCSKVHNGLYT